MEMATGSSSEPKEGVPCFFKVLRDTSAPHLSLPTAFVRRHLEQIPKNPILKTATGEHSWRVKIKKIGGDYCFAHGWEKLVRDAQLRITDFLVWWLIDPFTFQVSFFDANGCEKDLPSNITNFSGDGDDDDDGHDVMPDENPCFQKAFSEKTHKYTMSLPTKFVEAAGLGNKTGVMMKDPEGKEWVMGLMAERYRRTKYSLSSGWSLFREYQGLSDGDICLFKFIKKEGVLSLSQVLKSKRARNQENQHKETPNVEGVKRKRGRPPLKKLLHGDGCVDVKIEHEPGLVKRKSGRRPLENPCDGSVNVKIDHESGPEAEDRHLRKRGRPPPLEKPSGGVNVKIEDEEVAVVKRKRGRPPREKPLSGGVDIKIEYESSPAVVEVKTEPETEVVGRKRGRPPRLERSERVIYF